MTPRPLAFVPALLALLTFRPAAAAELDWYRIDRDVVDALAARDVGQWANDLAAVPADGADAAEWVRRLDVAARAGHADQARAAIDALGKLPLADDQGLNSGLSQVADFLIDRQDWDLVRNFLERVPQAHSGWGYVFVKHWAEAGDPAEIDRWLAARAEADLTARDPSDDELGYWLKERIAFRTARGTQAELLKALADDVRAHPTAVGPALRYLQAAGTANDAADVVWVGDVCKPPVAWESYVLGQALAARAPAAAVPVLQRSLDTPFTVDDERPMRRAYARAMTAAEHEKALRTSTRLALVDCYRKTGQPDKAQKLMEQVTAESPDGLPPAGLSQLAGQVQAASGARVIEGRIRAAEPENQNSPAYWLGRAGYYAGRKEDRQARDAFERALALAPLDANEPLRGHGNGGVVKSGVLRDYVNYVARVAGNRDAYELAWANLKNVPADHQMTRQIVRFLVYGIGINGDGKTRVFLADDERLWTYLAAAAEWDSAEERLVWEMAKAAPAGDARERFWRRAEGLAGGADGHPADPSRAARLGWVMTRCTDTDRGLNGRAVPLLKDAVARLKDDDKRQSTAFNLFETYLDLNDWRAAEAVWSDARARLTPKERPEWYAKLAVAAARAGAADDAMRLWSRAANFDRLHLAPLGDLARAGLADRLNAFYDDMAKSDPASTAPAAALRHLAGATARR